jgi:hypothetical protein
MVKVITTLPGNINIYEVDNGSDCSEHYATSANKCKTYF